MRKKYQMIDALISIIVTTIISVIAVVVGSKVSQVEEFVPYIIAVAVIIMILSIVHLHFKLKNLYYKKDLELDTIDVYRGVIFKHYSKYPIRKLQNVGLKQGPILKACKLANVQLINGGEIAQVELVSLDEAEKLVEEITKVINRKLDEN